MGSSPFISVCIPCHNAAGFIARTIQSVLIQDFCNFELIISDNKSTDDTISVVNSFADPRIKLIQNASNLGMCRNANKVLSCATGRHVKLLCADDILYPECLSRQVQVLEDPANRAVVLAICNRHIINASDQVVLRRRFPFRRGLISGERLIRYCTRSGLNLIGEPAVGLFRREALVKTSMCPVSNPYLMDLSLWAELLKHGDAFIDPDYLAAFRISRNAGTVRIGARQAAEFRQFVRALRSQPLYRPSWLDCCLAYVLSFQWCVLRNLFLKLNSC